MNELVFVDTNVLIYARDRRNAPKRDVARAWLFELVERRCARLNLQVLNEFTRWVLGHERGVDLAEIRAEVDALRFWGDKPLDEEEVELAWKIRDALGYQWFDCLLIAAADRAGCRYFLTEDMSDRARFGAITLVNPFRAMPPDILQQH